MKLCRLQLIGCLYFWIFSFIPERQQLVYNVQSLLSDFIYIFSKLKKKKTI